MSTVTSGKASGEWLYTYQDAALLTKIQANGWKPELYTGSKYGCGVYLSRAPWYSDASEALVCRVELEDEEVMDTFSPGPRWKNEIPGKSYKHLARYLQSQGVIKGNHPPTEQGNSRQNVAIRDHFLGKDIKAIRFVEHDHNVLVVYDCAVISIRERRQLAT